MREISEETIESITVFIRGLDEDQRPDFMERIAEKQYHLYTYIYDFLDDDTSEKGSDTAMYIFSIIIRCYEYEYGEFPEVSWERVKDYSNEKVKYANQELKRISPGKLANGFKRAAGQRVLVSHLEEIIEGNKSDPSGFEDFEKSSMKVAIYFIIFLLNEEMEKN